MKNLLIAFVLGLTSVSASAEIRIPVKTIDMFAITSTNKLILTSSHGSFVAPFSSCSTKGVQTMDKPNIYFLRPFVKEKSTVVIYDQKNRKHTIRCDIKNLEKHDKLYLAKI